MTNCVTLAWIGQPFEDNFVCSQLFFQFLYYNMAFLRLKHYHGDKPIIWYYGIAYKSNINDLIDIVFTKHCLFIEFSISIEFYIQKDYFRWLFIKIAYVVYGMCIIMSMCLMLWTVITSIYTIKVLFMNTTAFVKNKR